MEEAEEARRRQGGRLHTGSAGIGVLGLPAAALQKAADARLCPLENDSGTRLPENI
jgi:hypothetical protein